MIDSDQIIRAYQLLEKNGGTQDAQIHEIKKYRAIILSDIHLGSRGSKAKQLVGFLNHAKPDIIYLNGDFIDGWQLGILGPQHIGRLFQQKASVARTRFPQAHADVLQKLLRLGRAGSYIFYIPGNHDEFIRPYLAPIPDTPRQSIEDNLGWLAAAQEMLYAAPEAVEAAAFFEQMHQIGRVFMVRNIVHPTKSGKRLLITHGDEFDALLKGQRVIGRLGTRAREALFQSSEWLSRKDGYGPIRNASRRLLGLSDQFSLADYAYQFKSDSDIVLPKVALTFIETQNEVTQRKRAAQTEWRNEPLLDGIICGHNHIPAMITFAQDRKMPLHYMNSGDWMHHCTALVEEHDGRIHLVQWDDAKGIVDFTPKADPNVAARLKPRSHFVSQAHL